MKPEECETLEDVRHGIDRIDRELITLLGQRQRFVMKASEFKKNMHSVGSPERVETLLEDRKIRAWENGLDILFVENLFRQITDHFIDRESIRREIDNKNFSPEMVKIIPAVLKDAPSRNIVCRRSADCCEFTPSI